MPEASVNTHPSKDTPQAPTGPQRATQGHCWAYVDLFYLVLTCPDGRVIKLGYDYESAKEIARSFKNTKVKATVVREKTKYRREVK